MPSSFPNLPILAAALQATFHGLSGVSPLSVLGEGFSSLAVETPWGAVFRIPRTAEVGRRYAHEFACLPLLRPHLPVSIPDPRWYSPPCDLFPHGVIGYPRLPGRPLDFPDFRDPSQRHTYAGQMAAILWALHCIPAANLPLQDNWPRLRREWQSQREAALPTLEGVLSKDEYRRVADWWRDFLAGDNLHVDAPVVVHGDFWFGNLLAEDGCIIGLVDFERLALGDPALDFVPLLYLGEGFYRLVLDEYQRLAGRAVDPGFAHRLAQLWSAREFDGIDYAVRNSDPAEFAESLDKLRKSPILSPAGLDGWSKSRF